MSVVSSCVSFSSFLSGYYVSPLFRIHFSAYRQTKLENLYTNLLGEGGYFYIFAKIN